MACWGFIRRTTRRASGADAEAGARIASVPGWRRIRSRVAARPAAVPHLLAALKGALGQRCEGLRSDRHVVHSLVTASSAALSAKSEALRAFPGAPVDADAVIAGDPAAAQVMVVGHRPSAMGQGAAARDAVADTFRDRDVRLDSERGLLDPLVDEGASDRPRVDHQM